MTEIDVIAHAAQGDEAAQRVLFETYWARAFRLAYLLLNDAGDAEEVAQDAFVYAFRNLHRFDDTRGSLWAWLRVILVSRSRNRRRRRQLLTVSLDSLDAIGQPAVDSRPAHNPTSWTEELGARRAIWEALQQVSPGAREALILRYYEELPYEQIGSLLGCSADAARARVAYGKTQLRRILQTAEGALLEWVGRFIENRAGG